MKGYTWINNEKENFWQNHYKNYDFFQNQLDWYRETIKFHIDNMSNCQEIIDTGAWSWNLAIELSQIGKDVTAVDNEIYALNLLSEKAQQKNLRIKTVNADVQALPFQWDAFDWAASMFVIPFVENTEKYLTEIYRILKQGGIFSASIRAPIQNIKDGRNMKKEIVDILTNKNILPKYQKKWERFLDTSKENAKNVDSKNITKNKIKLMLENVGFVDIFFDTNVAYGEYAYFLQAKKPDLNPFCIIKWK